MDNKELLNEQNPSINDDGFENFRIDDYLNQSSQSTSEKEKPSKEEPSKEEPSKDESSKGESSVGETTEGESLDEKPYYAAAEFDVVKTTEEVVLPVGNFRAAISEDGKTRVTDYGTLGVVLSDPRNVGKKYFLFDTENRSPYCVKVLQDGFAISKAAIGPDYQVGDQLYEAKKSLKLEDVSEIAKLNDARTKLIAQKEEAKAIKKNPNDYLRKFENDYNSFKARENEIKAGIKERLAEQAGKPVDEFAAEPKLKLKRAPELGVGNTIARVLLKIVTLGLAETDAYKNYQQALKRFQEESKPYYDERKTYKAEKDLLDKTIEKEYNEKLIELGEKFTDAEERVDFINEELEELNGELALAEHSIKSINNKVNDYHSKTEVIMEGLADLDRHKGEVTQDNIFANTWIHRKEIEGKNPVSFGEKDVDHLAGFVVSKIAEQKTLDNFLHNPTYAKGQQNNAILVGINSGSAVDAMKKDPVFNEFLKQAQEANKPMNLDSFAEAVEKGIKVQLEKNTDPLSKVKAAQKIVVDKFGTKPLSADCLLDVAKYRLLKSTINTLEANIAKNGKFSSGDTNLAIAVVTEVLSVKDTKNPVPPNSKLAKYLVTEKRNSFNKLCEHPKLQGKEYSLSQMSSMASKMESKLGVKKSTGHVHKDPTQNTVKEKPKDPVK